MAGVDPPMSDGRVDSVDVVFRNQTNRIMNLNHDVVVVVVVVVIRRTES